MSAEKGNAAYIKNKKMGILFILCAAFGFAMMNLFVKLSGDLPVMEKCFFRNLVAAFIALASVIKHKESIRLERRHILPMIGRCLAGTLGMVANFYAVGQMHIADASILNKLSPFFSIIFSYFLLKEHPKKLEWVAVFIAFAGALFVIKPTFNMTSFPAFIGFLSGIGAGMAYTCVRWLGNHGVKGSVIVFYFSATSCLGMVPAMLFNFHPLSFLQLLFLLLAGGSAAIGQFAITAAYTRVPAKEISVFDYTQVIFAAILSFFVFGNWPDHWSLVGYVIIIGTAVWRWNYMLKQDVEKA